MADGNSNRQYQGFTYPSASPTTAPGTGVPPGGMPYYGGGSGPSPATTGLVRRTAAAAPGAPAATATGSQGGVGYGYFHRPASSVGGHSGFGAGSDAGSSHGPRASMGQRPAVVPTTSPNVSPAGAPQRSPASHFMYPAGGSHVTPSSATRTTAVHVQDDGATSENSNAGYPMTPTVVVDTKNSSNSGSVVNRTPGGHSAGGGPAVPWGYNYTQQQRRPHPTSSTAISFLPPTVAVEDAELHVDGDEDDSAAVNIGGDGQTGDSADKDHHGGGGASTGGPYAPGPSPYPPSNSGPLGGPYTGSKPSTQGGYFGAVPLSDGDGFDSMQTQQLQQQRPVAPSSSTASKGFFKDMMNRLLSDLDEGGSGSGPSSISGGGGSLEQRDEPRPLHQTRFGCPEDDLPLLEELGIFPQHIWKKAKAVLNPFKPMPMESVEDTDLAGPLVFAIALAFLLSLQGKIQFSAIYGLSVLGVLLFKALLTLMHGAGNTGANPAGAPLQFIISSLGYALLPSLVLAVLRTVQFWLAGGHSTMLLPLAFLVIGWSSWCATSLVVRGLNMERQRFLILYPMVLFYSVFAALTIF